MIEQLRPTRWDRIRAYMGKRDPFEDFEEEEMTEPFTHTSTENEEIFDFTPKPPQLVIYETYRLDLLGPPISNKSTSPIVPSGYALSKNLLEEIRENISDLLPEGYEVAFR